ncbi:KLRG1 protein, partial [Polypterus senegalus]|nr:uncharacterized protein LOC120528860 [Polypterus senegalus]MBN3289012.1 KLRG1 protein [Polypterus senegalus]
MTEEHTYQDLLNRDLDVYLSLKKQLKQKNKEKLPKLKTSVDSGAETIKEENTYETLIRRDVEAYSSHAAQDKKKKKKKSPTDTVSKDLANEISFTNLGEDSYYFSTEKKAWRSSSDFCAQHQATLAVFKDKEELNRVLWYITNHTLEDSYWIGLQKNNFGFTLDVSDPSRGCAMLRNKSLNASHCNTTSKWICKKSSKRSCG